MADSNSKQVLQSENLRLIKKRESYANKLKEVETELEQNNKDLGIIDSSAYGRAFITGGNREVSKSQRRNVMKKIHKLPIDQTTVLGVKKSLIAAGHGFSLKSLEFSPDGYSFVTTCGGGKINLWESRSTEDPFITKSIYASVDNRKWPEDVAFFKNGDSLVAVYKTVDMDQQIAVIKLNPQNEENEKEFVRHGLKDAQGGINRVICPNDNSFITANQDRSVYLWDIEKLTPTLCHKKYHSNNISDICGLTHRSIVISVGLDKNVFGYDYGEKQKDTEVNLKSPCLAVEANPLNQNLLVIQTKSDDNQLVLLDYRKKKSICEFGWKTQQKTKSQVVSPSWSPSGWLVSTGSIDSDIKIFDIRILREDPAQIIRNVHTNRVFKAAFHPLQPVLVSISSDHLLGFHVIKT